MLVDVLLVALALWPVFADEGSLRVKTDISEVEVFLDGNSVGKTPLALSQVAVGAHHLSLIKAGYEDHEQEIQIQSGTTAKLFVMMKALPSAPPKLPAQFYAIHQHAAGTACSGILSVNAEAIDYRAHDGRDVFHIPISEVRSLSRSLGPNWWTGRPLYATSENTACRLEVAGRSYGFFAYEEDPKLAGTPAENRIGKQERSAKTKELYELIYRLWSEFLAQKSAPKQAAR